MDSTVEVYRYVAALVGLMFLYLKFALYESEEKDLQNRLVDLWCRIDEKAELAREVLTGLMKETARITLKIFDRIFGIKIVSVQSVSVSISIVFSSIFIMAFGYGVVGGVWEYSALIIMLGVLGGVFLFFSLLPMFSKRAYIPWLSGIPSVALIALMMLDRSQSLKFCLFILLIVFIASAMDFLWLLIYRAWARWAYKNSKVYPYILLAIIGALLAYVTSIYPREYMVSSSSHNLSILAIFFLMFSITRLFILIVSSVHVLVLAVACLHRVFWPFISRLVYAAERYKVFKERKLFGVIGGMLLVYALAGSRWIDVVINAV